MNDIVVIGHGRSPEGRGWSSRIDAASRVIRMWNWHWQSAGDYGVKYDVGILETHKKILDQWRSHNQHTPSIGWVVSKLGGVPDRAMPTPRVIVDQQRWLTREGLECAGAGETGKWELTRGGIAACWAIKTADAGDRVVLVGFDVIKAGVSPSVDQAFSPAYMASGGFWGVDGFKAGATKEGNHDYPAERRLIWLVSSRRDDVSVVFAEDIWL